MTSRNQTLLQWFENGAGFFGRKYIEGDDSLEGFQSIPQTLSMRTSYEVEGIVRLLSLPLGASILDCPCGYGRHSIALAAKGYNVLGSDINQEMLEAACRDADGAGNLEFACENMLNINYESRFDAVINMFLAFGFFLEENDNARVLSNFFRALKPGGHFLLHTDVNVGRITSGKYKFCDTRNLRSGRKLEIVESFDPVYKRLNGQWIMIDSIGTREELPPYSCRIYTATEITELCRLVGFASVQIYGGWSGAALENDSEEMIVVASRSK